MPRARRAVTHCVLQQGAKTKADETPSGVQEVPRFRMASYVVDRRANSPSSTRSEELADHLLDATAPAVFPRARMTVGRGALFPSGSPRITITTESRILLWRWRKLNLPIANVNSNLAVCRTRGPKCCDEGFSGPFSWVRLGGGGKVGSPLDDRDCGGIPVWRGCGRAYG